jgi:hypothetical protein
MSELEEHIDFFDAMYLDAGVTLGGHLGVVVNAARRMNDPLDELWWCKTHDRPIDRFNQLKPIECLYRGRPGPCEPIAALIVTKETHDSH